MVRHTVRLPRSKSVALRLMVLDWIEGRPVGAAETDPDDVKALASALEALGRQCRKSPEGESAETHMAEAEFIEIHIEEGGAPYRFLMALAASLPGAKVRLTAGERLSNRPIMPLVEALAKAGARLRPLPGGRGWEITGERLRGGELEVDCSQSTQFLSALILASPLWERPLSPSAPSVSGQLPAAIPSWPYVEMTRRLVEAHAAGLARDEADWSAAATFLALERLTVVPLDFRPALEPPGRSLQGDSRIVGLLDACEEARAAGRVFEADMASTPDIVPSLAIHCLAGGVPFRMRGVGNLRLKESDRLEALRTEAAKFGWTLETEPDGLAWRGERVSDEPGEVEVCCHGDHRMAMAFAMLRPLGHRVSFDHPEVVAKSFPGFWEELAALERHLKDCGKGESGGGLKRKG